MGKSLFFFMFFILFSLKSYSAKAIFSQNCYKRHKREGEENVYIENKKADPKSSITFRMLEFEYGDPKSSIEREFLTIDL